MCPTILTVNVHASTHRQLFPRTGRINQPRSGSRRRDRGRPLVYTPAAPFHEARTARAVVNYLEKLPLDCVRQIHISGPRLWNGVLWDAHETLQANDYDLLAWALARCDLEVVTLEYFWQRDLGEQLWILPEILAG